MCSAGILLDECDEFDVRVRHLLWAKQGRLRHTEPIRESASAGTEFIEALDVDSGVLPQQSITPQTETEQPRADTGLTGTEDGRAPLRRVARADLT
jgi:hypothetical protein